MKDKKMCEVFKVGDKVQRNKAWIEDNPGFPQIVCKVCALVDGGFLDTDMGHRMSETMEVVERDGIRIGDPVHVGLPRPWRVKSFPQVGLVEVSYLGLGSVIKSEDATKWEVSSDERRMENSETKEKQGDPEPFVVSDDGFVFIRDAKLGITHARVKQPAPAAQQYQDLVDALIQYNALVDKFPDAPKFKLVTL